MRKPFNGDFSLTQGFGGNPDSYAKFGLKGHDGLDYGLPTGTEVVAPHSGKIIEAAFDANGYGNYLKIENDKEGSVLAHLKEFRVKVGDVVTEGQLIAISNNTGNSTGAHLHWGYYLFPRNRQNGYGGFIDQTPYLTASTPTTTTIPLEKDKFEELVDKSTKYDTFKSAGYTVIDDVTKKVGDLEKDANDKQNALNTLNAKVVDLNQAMAKDHQTSYDEGIVLMKREAELRDLQADADAVAFKLGVAPFNKAGCFTAIEKLQIPVESAVKPVMQERNELYKLLFEDGKLLYKKFRENPGFVKSFVNRIVSIFRR